MKLHDVLVNDRIIATRTRRNGQIVRVAWAHYSEADPRQSVRSSFDGYEWEPDHLRWSDWNADDWREWVAPAPVRRAA